MTKPSIRFYPGMLPGTGTEFFNYENEDFVIENGVTKPFEQMGTYTMQILLREMNTDSAVLNELIILHPDCEMKRLKKFTRCRLGGLDFHPDIQNGELQKGEYWPCPLRGNCRSEGILCRLPHFQGKQLTNQDVTLIQMLTSDRTNEVIADEMELAPGSLHKAKKFLYKKLDQAQTKQKITQIAIFLNLI